MKKWSPFLILLVGLLTVSCNLDSPKNNTSDPSTTPTSNKTWNVDYAELTNKITTETMRAVVTIDAISYNTNSYGEITSYLETTGSGVIIQKTSNSCCAITNNHVVVKKAGYSNVKYAVYDYLGNSHFAALATADPNFDLGIIVFSKDNVDFNVINSFRTTELEIGEPIVSLGQPKGQTNSITFGKVLSYQKANKLVNVDEHESNVTFKIMIHDAKVASGSSGGPVLDTHLNIAGLNYSGGVKDSNGFSTVSGAIPSNVVLQYWNDWIKSI